MSAAAVISPGLSPVTDICRQLRLSGQAKALLRPGIPHREFVNALLRNGDYATAVDFVAHALKAREAIWWACLCLQHESDGVIEGEDKKACAAAVLWIMNPCEGTAAAAKAAGQQAGHRSPAGTAAFAASNAQSSFGHGKLVALSVKLTAVRGDARLSVQRYPAYIELGMELLKA